MPLRRFCPLQLAFQWFACISWARVLKGEWIEVKIYTKFWATNENKLTQKLTLLWVWIPDFDFSISASFWAFFLSSSICLQFSSCARRNIRTKFSSVEITAFFNYVGKQFLHRAMMIIIWQNYWICFSTVKGATFNCINAHNLFTCDISWQINHTIPKRRKLPLFIIALHGGKNPPQQDHKSYDGHPSYSKWHEFK